MLKLTVSYIIFTYFQMQELFMVTIHDIRTQYKLDMENETLVKPFKYVQCVPKGIS